jgi:hypothetical protein
MVIFDKHDKKISFYIISSVTGSEQMTPYFYIPVKSAKTLHRTTDKKNKDKLNFLMNFIFLFLGKNSNSFSKQILTLFIRTYWSSVINLMRIEKQRIQTIFKKNNLKQILLGIAFILFLLALLGRFIKQFFSVYTYESWQVSEFLINYQGGFVRRGLTGEILFFFTKNFNINIELTIKIVCLICLVLVCIFFVRAFLKKGYSLYILPLCFFLSSGILSNFWIRKDYLFFVLFISLFWIYSKNNLPILMKLIVINVLATFIILSHEVFAFFSLPILFMLFFNQNKNIGVLKSISLSLVYLSPSIIAFLSTLYFHGNDEIAQTIWNSWAAFFHRETLYIGKSVAALGWSSAYAFKKHIILNFFITDHNILSLWVWVITFPMVYYIATNALIIFRKNERIFTNRDRTVLSSVLIFQLLCLSPVLILLSCDYSRIIFYWIASSFALFLLIPTAKIEKLFPLFFIRFVEHINIFLTNILHPSKTTFLFLMMIIGISSYSFSIERTYTSTMLYNIFWVVSQPFHLAKLII